MAKPRQAGEGWPRAADAAAAARLAERFAALGAAQARLAGTSRGAALLAAIGGNSPYLADLALREPGALAAVLRRGPQAPLAAALAALDGAAAELPRATVAALLRRAKRQVALVTGLADLTGLWSLEAIIGALTALAEATLGLAVRHLLLASGLAGPDRGDPAKASGFTVLGMGKLGARELNYSSDIDLVLLYDPVSYHQAADEAASRAGAFARLARALVPLMEARDGDGYVFRTDLRLRPDPASTPPAVSLPTAIAYYESMGQTWERAAMLKARPVAGDLALGAEFLTAIRPFVWRRHLDFAAVADLHAMKQRIDTHKVAARQEGIAGRNLKLGRGGIREIEFVAQILQLVWGGRDPVLREPATLPALELLAEAGHLPKAASRALAAAYRFLRGAEHRLQMVADRQTHSLPEREEDIAAFAIFMGLPDAAALSRAVLQHTERVHAEYQAIFQAADGGEVFDIEGGEAALAAMGFAEPARALEAIGAWRDAKPRALRSERARDLLTRLLPRLLAALAAQAQPDVVLRRFDAFLARQPAGVQLLALFNRNPALIGRVAAVLGAAPALAEHLARVPAALEGLLEVGTEVRPGVLLASRLVDARDLEVAIGIIRRAVQEEDFRLSVATMEGRLDADAAGLARAALADAAIAALLPFVLADHARRYGRIAGGGLAVVALGKAGGREMMAGSDLDLMLVYDHAEDAGESTGRAVRRLPPSQYYLRLAPAFIAALTAPGAGGPTYAIDMRLRPSGNKGPVAVSLAAFRHYHQPASEGGSAWTWERMALTRARVVAGPAGLRRRVAAAIEAALRHGVAPAQIGADAAAMRARLVRDLPPQGSWDVKHLPGGMMEVEFVAQTRQLIALQGHGGFVRSASTRVALRRLAAAGLLARRDAAALVAADRLWRTVQGMLRITVGRQAEAALPAPALAALLRAVGEVDAAGLEARVAATAARVSEIVARVIGVQGEEKAGQ